MPIRSFQRCQLTIRLAMLTKKEMEKPIKVIPALSRVTAIPLAITGGNDTKRISSTVAASPVTIAEIQDAQPLKKTKPASPITANNALTAIGAREPIHFGIASTINEASSGIALKAKWNASAV